MKTLILTLLFASTILFTATAQEVHGKTLNLGLGIGGYSGYYGYLGRSLPVLHIDYELDVVQAFTLAPFISFYTYSNDYYWGNNNTPYKYYGFRETVIPIGLKGSYYFDDLLGASTKWDFYLAGSLGFAIIKSRWEAGYNGDKNYFRGSNPLFFDIHIGTEYHFSPRIGAILDLSSGVSTLGVAIHSQN